MANTNKNLQSAKNSKSDEFYTQLKDVEAEMQHYMKHFKDKVVLCNCDDPTWSAFWEYFHRHFKELGLKRLISTHYEKEGSPSYAISYKGGDDDNLKTGTKRKLKGNGDFRSEECVRLLKKADIVVTNPPFSLFREYIEQLVNHNKSFLIIGNINAITYKEVFPLIQNNYMWLGATIHSGDRKFYVPNSYPLNAAGCGIDENGHRFIRVKGVRWFTNMDYENRHNYLQNNPKFIYKGNEEYFPKYDNYNAINVNRTTEIPFDYMEVIGVPITFLDKYCPEQFEIIGNEYTLNISKGRGYINGKRMYSRIFIRNKAVIRNDSV